MSPQTCAYCGTTGTTWYTVHDATPLHTHAHTHCIRERRTSSIFIQTDNSCEELAEATVGCKESNPVSGKKMYGPNNAFLVYLS